MVKYLTLYFLCRSGHRSLMAANFMANIGYKNLLYIDDFEGNLQNKAGNKIIYRGSFK